MTYPPGSLPSAGPRSARVRSVHRPRLVHVVSDALAEVDGVRVDLDVPGASEARALRDRLSAQLRTHLLPRLREVDQPAVVVLGGSTGTGKSTLLNSLIGSEVSPAGVLRPTTRKPVLAVNPADEEVMTAHPLAAVVAVVAHVEVPPGLALLDTPDLDSVNEANRALGALLIEAADLWVFVTTATRYGDAVPWALLQAARSRGVTVTVVLNRVSTAALVEVRADLLDRLVAAGLGEAPLFVLPDLGPHEGLLPREHVADLERWLDILAGRTHSAAVVARTIRGSWPSLRTDLGQLADAVDAQAAAAAELRRRAREQVVPEAAAVAADIEAGTPSRGGPTTHWLALASAGGPLSPLVTGHRPGFRRGSRIRERSAAAAVLRGAVLDATAGAVVDAAARAQRAVLASWSAPGPGGRHLADEVDRSDAPRARVARVRDGLNGWAGAVAGDLAAWDPPIGGRAAQLLGAGGWADLLCAAAAGVDGAARAVAAGLGERGRAALAAARSELIAVARGAVLAEADPFVAAADALGLDESSALGLRVRASELRGLG